jgi:polyphenol oxidase
MTLEIITSDRLSPLRHGFFTRKGGASSGIFSGLNCGHGSTDQGEIVAINRSRAAQAMGLKPGDLAMVHQVHSADALTVSAPPEHPRPDADALVTVTPGLGLAILTADCQPVLFADPGTKIIGAAHAGWKGALGGILEATLDAMVKIGARRNHIQAVIGPSISQKAYEVGEEFRETFMTGDTASARFFIANTNGKFQFDLPGYGLSRLRAAGIAHAEWTGHCTYGDPDRFYSYRRSFHKKEADYGRLVSIIVA